MLWSLFEYETRNEEGEPEELIDITYFCSRQCGQALIDVETNIVDPDDLMDWVYTFHVSYGAETDYDVYCGGCDQFLWHGLNP